MLSRGHLRLQRLTRKQRNQIIPKPRFGDEVIAQQSATGRPSGVKSISLVSKGQKAGIQQNQREKKRGKGSRM